MKGTFAIQGHSISIDLIGESWTRDQAIKGSLNISEAGKISQTGIGLAFCEIDLRKLKKKDPKAFQILKKIDLIDGQGEYSLDLSSQESGGAHPLSDGIFTLGLIAGNLESPLSCSQLQLQVKPREVVNDFLKLFETFKRCTIKSIKNKKKDIEVKIAAPKTGDMAQIDSLAIIFQFKEEVLNLTYQFTLKKLTIGGAGVETVKEKFNFKQSLQKSDYQSFGQIDQDKALAKIDEALSEAKGLSK